MEASVISLVRIVNREFHSLLCPDNRLDTTPGKTVDEAALEALASRLEQARDFIDPVAAPEQDFQLDPDVAELLENLDRVDAIREGLAIPLADRNQLSDCREAGQSASALDGQGNRISSAQAQRCDALMGVPPDHFEN